jgi:hypothetical protein
MVKTTLYRLLTGYIKLVELLLQFYYGNFVQPKSRNRFHSDKNQGKIPKYLSLFKALSFALSFLFVRSEPSLRVTIFSDYYHCFD